MKILLLCPSSYSIDKTIKLGLSRLGHEVIHFNYRDNLKNWKKKTNTQIFRLPFKIRNKWEVFYFSIINKIHLQVFEEHKPDAVFIYNNEMLLPETVEYFSNSAKVLFILGDNPYYTPTNNYNLTLLFNADLVLLPDSFWLEQLSSIGIKNCVQDYLGFNDEISYQIKPAANDLEKYGGEVLFVGNSYVDSWGYKRALFLNQFKDFTLKIYGTKNWIRWFEFFPELRKNFILLQEPISFADLNLISNCNKVYPVDGNPGLLNGLHVRIFDCIGSGVLPIVEYRRDIDKVFKGVEIPVIKSYAEAPVIARKYIEDDNLRSKTLCELRAFIDENYKPEIVLSRLISNVS